MKREFVPFHIPSIGEEEIQEVVDTLRSGWLTTGPKSNTFEENFSEYIGCKHAIATNSCTAALHLALDAIGLKKGDEVIIPTMTFSATGEVITYMNARPVLVDCNPDTLDIDIKAIEENITERSKCIIPVHYAGQACEMDEIIEISRENNLSVVEDAAHALPALYKDKKIGTIGDITCFSFYATKTLTTGEGGMACMDNDDYAERMKIMRLHGISKDAWKRYTAEGSWYYEVIEAGYKYNMPDISAALGIVQLRKCDDHLKKRARIAQAYTESFSAIPEIQTPTIRKFRTSAWHLYVIQLNLEMLKITRAQFIQKMKDNGVGCRVHFIPLHLHPFYRNTYGYAPDDFPVASRVYEKIVSLPIYPKMTDRDVDFVMDKVSQMIKENKR